MAITADDVVYALFELEQVTMSAERLAHFFRADVALIWAHFTVLAEQGFICPCYANVDGVPTLVAYALTLQGAERGKAIADERR
jgi:hypothetical protein